MPCNKHVRSKPTENAFSKTEDRTTTRAMGPSTIPSNAVACSCHKLFRIVHFQGCPSRSIACAHGSLTPVEEFNFS